MMGGAGCRVRGAGSVPLVITFCRDDPVGRLPGILPALRYASREQN